MSRWTHCCLTAPSMCKGHPIGMCDSSSSPSPFCSITVPSIGTSIDVLRLTRGRLQCHVSGESNPRFASSVTAGKTGWSRRSSASSLIISLRPWMGSGGPCAVPDVGSLVVVVSSNHVGRIDLTPIALLESVFLTLSLRKRSYQPGRWGCSSTQVETHCQPYQQQIPRRMGCRTPQQSSQLPCYHRSARRSSRSPPRRPAPHPVAGMQSKDPIGLDTCMGYAR